MSFVYVAIATQTPYRDVYKDVWAVLREKETATKGPRNGVPKKIVRALMERYGFKWTPTMRVGQGCTVHLRADELPDGRLIVSLSKHITVVLAGVIFDTYDPSRDGTRCVYGYWERAA